MAKNVRGLFSATHAVYMIQCAEYIEAADATCKHSS